MKKIVISVLILLAIAGIAVATCPDKAAHKEAIMAVINEKINETVNDSLGEGKEGLAIFASSLGSGIVGFALDNRLMVKNHFIYSTGEIKHYDGKVDRLSVGVFGHVFTFSKEDLDKALEDVL